MEDKTSYDPSATTTPNPNSNSTANSNSNNNNNNNSNNNTPPPPTNNNNNKLLAPTWLSGAAQVTENDQASNPASLHRKWCGAESGSQCVQCSFLHLNQTSASADSNPNPKSSPSPSNNPNSNPSPNPWLMQSSASPTMSMATKLSSADIVNNTAAASHLHNHLPQHHHQIIPVLNSPNSNKLLSAPISSASARHGHGNLMVDLHSDTANSSDLIDAEEAAAVAAAGGHSHAGPQPSAENIHQNNNSSNHSNSNNNNNLWSSRLKADISMHPLYSQLLAAHVSCLRIATPVDQLPRIDAQIAQAPQVIAKYELLGHNSSLVGEEKEELDQFMAHYVLLLCTFKEQLQQHVKVHAMEAVMACWELEQSLLTLTGVSPGEGTGATMSDDEQMDDPSSSSAAGLMMESDASMMFEGSGGGAFDCSLGHDSGAFGPLIPTETERTLMERVRQELKSELKNGYKERIVDVREEILRKRRAGKLPGDTTSVLKSWWHAHSKWPYPTEDEKARLVQETGLQLKQINNWFINQRKRNWHSNPSSTAALKSKRKR